MGLFPGCLTVAPGELRRRDSGSEVARAMRRVTQRIVEFPANYLARFIKPGGPVAVALAGFLSEIDDPVPGHLAEWWAAEMPYSLHSASWWRRHWERSGILDIAVADTLPDGWRFWLDWLKLVAPTNEKEIRALEADAGRHFGYVRAVGRRRAEAQLFDPLMSLPVEYSKQPLLRGSE